MSLWHRGHFRPGIGGLRPLLLALVCGFGAAPALAQSATCTTGALAEPDRVEVRCKYVTIEIEAGAEASLLDQDGDGEPEGLEVEAGAVLIEYGPTTKGSDFQILTPYAIASVRGTTWAVEVQAERTSVFVVEGTVAVVKTGYGSEVLLRAGDGVDAGPGPTPLQVKQWPAQRVKDLLARFGR